MNGFHLQYILIQYESMSDGIDYDKLSNMIKEAVGAQFNNQSTRDNSSLIIQVITLVGVMFVPVLTHWINAKYGTTGGPTGLPGAPGGLGRDVDEDEMDAEELAEAQRREAENALALQALDDQADKEADKAPSSDDKV